MEPARRVVIVGCGKIAGGFNEHDERKVLTHAAAYRDLGAPVVGCCDVDAHRAELFARRWAIPNHGRDLGPVLAVSRPDVVSICTPPAGRLPILEQVLRSPSVRAVLLEKPVAAGREEMEAIGRLVESAGRPVLVNYCRAFDPFYLRFAREHQAGAFGPLRQVTGRYYGSARTNASHLIERLIDMLGAPIRATRLSGSDESPVFEMAFETSDASAMFLPTPGCEYAPLELDFLFRQARVRVVDSEQRLERFVSRPDPNFAGFFNLVAVEDESGRPSHENIRDAVEQTLRAAAAPAPDPSFARALAVDRVLDQVRAA